MQQQAAPAYAPPPPDAALQQRIDTLVSYAAKNGMAFVQMMGERQGTNPEFAFLHGGEGAPYFAWALHCALNGQPAAAAAGQAAAPSPAAAAPQYAAAPQAAGAPVAQQQQQQQPAAAVQQQQPVSASPTAGVLADLPGEVSSGWGQVLGLLTASRDSIRNSQAWFMACAPYAAGMAEMMLQRIESLEGHHERQLHVVYLANDILFKAMSQRPAGSGPDADGVAQAFLPRLGRMLRRTFVSGGQTPEVQTNLLRVVNFWAERGVFSHLDVESLTMEMMGVSAPAAGAAGAAGAPGGPAGAQQQQAAPQQAQQQPVAPVDLAAAARAAAAAINRKVGHVDAPAPAAGGATSGRRKWDAAPPDAAIAAAAAAGAAAAAAVPASTNQWAQQAQSVLQQMQAPQQAGQPFGAAGAAAYGAPPPTASYYAPGAMPGQPGYDQQAYGAPPGGFYPPPGAYGQQPGVYPPPPGQPGAYPPPSGQPGAYPPPPGQPGGYPPPPGQQPGAYPPPPGQPGQQYPGQSGAYPPPPGAPPGGFYPPPGAPPGAYPPPPGPGGAVGYYPPPPGAEAQPPPPEEEPFDCMSFPPGLLPKLVEERLRTDPPYSPLSIFDIEQTGVPPPPKMDAYLKSRVAKFYAQLADYRPGMLFSDIETGDARHKHFSDRDGPGAAPAGGPPLPPSGPELPHAGLGLAQPAGMGMGFGMGGAPGLGLGAAPVDDGSFAGMRSGGTGLGFTRAERRDSGPHASEPGAGNGMAGAATTALGEAGPELVGRPGDVFSSYRYMRSKGYHQMIVENAAKKFGRGN